MIISSGAKNFGSHNSLSSLYKKTPHPLEVQDSLNNLTHPPTGIFLYKKLNVSEQLKCYFYTSLILSPGEISRAVILSVRGRWLR